MSCICENIQPLKKITKGPFRGGTYPDKNEDSIVSDKDGFYIWHDGGGDPFCADIWAGENINYCPVCGRELKAETE